jgi:hypothetical protein
MSSSEEGFTSQRATGQAKLAGVQAVSAVVDGLKTIADAVREIAVQETAREAIRHEAAVQIERIRACQTVIVTYLDRAFDERRANFDALFERVDGAIASSDLQAVALALDAIVALAKSSPLKDIADLGRAKRLLKDKDAEFEF